MRWITLLSLILAALCFYLMGSYYGAGLFFVAGTGFELLFLLKLLSSKNKRNGKTT